MALILPGMSFGISAQFCSRCPGSAFTGVGSLSHRGCVLFLCFTVGNDVSFPHATTITLYVRLHLRVPCRRLGRVAIQVIVTSPSRHSTDNVRSRQRCGPELTSAVNQARRPESLACVPQSGVCCTYIPRVQDSRLHNRRTVLH